MTCPNCQAENPETSRFCADCGSRLGRANEIDNLQTITLKPSLRALAAGTVFAGRYKVLGELERGGMGEVYLAEDATVARKVALKLLPEETYQDPEARRRFVREAKAAAALDHPYICSIYELGAPEIEENLAYAFLQKGDWDAAIEKYLEFLKVEPLGYEPQESWILAHYQLGKLYQKKGLSEEARKHFQRFLEIWEEGDPDLPALSDARKQLSLLK